MSMRFDRFLISLHALSWPYISHTVQDKWFRLLGFKPDWERYRLTGVNSEYYRLSVTPSTSLNVGIVETSLVGAYGFRLTPHLVSAQYDGVRIHVIYRYSTDYRLVQKAMCGSRYAKLRLYRQLLA